MSGSIHTCTELLILVGYQNLYRKLKGCIGLRGDKYDFPLYCLGIRTGLHRYFIPYAKSAYLRFIYRDFELKIIYIHHIEERLPSPYHGAFLHLLATYNPADLTLYSRITRNDSRSVIVGLGIA